MTPLQFLGMLRNDLDSPDQNAPTLDMMAQKITSVAQMLANKLGSQNVSWSIGTADIPVVPGQRVYALPATGIGKILSPAYTADPENPNFTRTPVMVIDEVDAALEYYARTISPGTEKHDVHAFIFKWKDGTPYVEATNNPQNAALYQVLYEVGSIGAFNLGASIFPLPEPWHDYARELVAKTLLPYCHWSKLKTPNPNQDPAISKANFALQAAHRAEIEKRLDPTIAYSEKAFESWIRTNRKQGTISSYKYGQRYDNF